MEMLGEMPEDEDDDTPTSSIQVNTARIEEIADLEPASAASGPAKDELQASSPGPSTRP